MSYFRGLVMLVMVVEIVPGRNEILSSGLFYRRSPQLAKTPASCSKQAVQLRLLCDPAGHGRLSSSSPKLSRILRNTTTFRGRSAAVIAEHLSERAPTAAGIHSDLDCRCIDFVDDVVVIGVQSRWSGSADF